MSLYRPDRRFLAEQLETIDAQTYDDMDVLVYNDCPEDDGWEAFCHEHCSRHELTYIHADRNRGYIKAFEKLVTLARGDLIALCDQDDRWKPERVERCVREFLNSRVLLTCCDRSIIDAEGEIVEESWRHSHPSSRADSWNTGDSFVGQAVFACYSIGMATMVRASFAKAMIPFPECTGHDKWLALCANAAGVCAYVDEPLVLYRRHGTNVSGRFAGIRTKRDWYERRVLPSYQLAQTFAERFPDAPEDAEILAFAQARKDRDIKGIWRGRHLAPDVATFEIAQKLMPEVLFDRLVSR